MKRKANLFNQVVKGKINKLKIALNIKIIIKLMKKRLKIQIVITMIKK